MICSALVLLLVELETQETEVFLHTLEGEGEGEGENVTNATLQLHDAITMLFLFRRTKLGECSVRETLDILYSQRGEREEERTKGVEKGSTIAENEMSNEIKLCNAVLLLEIFLSSNLTHRSSTIFFFLNS